MRRKSTRRRRSRRTHKNVGSKSRKLPLNCNPGNAVRRIADDTCMTIDAVDSLKDAINRTSSYVGVKVKETLPIKIYKKVKKILKSKCQEARDDCVLQVLDSKVREEYLETLYAPNKPDEWSENSTEWLSNYDILAVLNQYEELKKDFHIYGPTPIDYDLHLQDGKCVNPELCSFILEDEMKKGIHKFGMIFNLSRHDEDGSHWVSLFVDTDDEIIFYFDSGKSIPPSEITTLVNHIKEQGSSMGIKFKYYETPRQHQYGNTECGMYALYFIVTMITSTLSNGTKITKDEKLNHFRDNRIPDNFVFALRDKYFNNV